MREYFLTLLVTATVTYLLTPLVRRVAIKVGAVPAVRERDVHAVPIPRMGGIAMYVGLAAGLLVAGELVPLRSVFPGSGLVSGLLLAGGLIVVIGMIDDRWGMNALGKLAGQVAAGGILVASGAQLSSFPEPHDHLFSLTPNESIVLTILVVVATINAVNFIDGLDGLAAGIVCIAAISFFSYYYTLAKVGGFSAEGAPALASVVLAGACLGFLPHNFYPARIIMGDTGSMLLGLLLAYVPISAISSLDYISLHNKANRFPEILPLLLPAAVLVIPYVDMLRAVVRRTRVGQSPFAPDRKHLHHRMIEIGHTHRSSVLILYAWAALFAGTVVGLSFVTVDLRVLAGITFAAVLVLVLLSIPKLRWWQRGASREYESGPMPADRGLAPAAQNGLAAGLVGTGIQTGALGQAAGQAANTGELAMSGDGRAPVAGPLAAAIDPMLPDRSSAPKPVFRPAEPRSAVSPGEPGPAEPGPAGRGPVFRPSEPGPVVSPAEPRPVFRPSEPGPVVGSAELGPVFGPAMLAQDLRPPSDPEAREAAEPAPGIRADRSVPPAGPPEATKELPIARASGTIVP